jgi:hypothetical protein
MMILYKCTYDSTEDISAIARLVNPDDYPQVPPANAKNPGIV